MVLLDLEDQLVKLENQAEMDFLVFPEHLDPQAMLAMEQLERKVFQGFQGPKVFPVVLVNLALAMLEHQASVELMENLAYLDYQGHQVYLGQEAKCCLAPFLVRMETPVSLVSRDDQVLKVNQVSQEALDVQGSMGLKEREETLVLGDNLDLKVSQGPEEILEFQVPQEGRLMEAEARMESLGVLEPRASLERC